RVWSQWSLQAIEHDEWKWCFDASQLVALGRRSSRAPHDRTPAMSALSGIRVLDLTRLLPGPFASLVLADLGAQVDKIEDPQMGDYTRVGVPQVGGMSAAFHALNRGKRSAVLDLKKPEGIAAFRRLLPHYHVLFEQFRPGVLERLGLGHTELLREN